MVYYGTLVQEEIIDLSLRNNFFIIWLCGGVIKAEQGQLEQTSPRLPVDINGSKHFPIEIGSSSIYIYIIKSKFITLLKLLQKDNFFRKGN